MDVLLTIVLVFNIPILLYLCVVNFRILQYEIRIHEVEIKLLEVSYRLVNATEEMRNKL